MALAQKRDFIEGDGRLHVAAFGGGLHAQRVDDREFRSLQAVCQVFLAVVIHQEPDRAAVHAVNGQARGDEAVHGLEHVAVAAQRHDHVGAVGIPHAVEFPGSLVSARLAAGELDATKAMRLSFMRGAG